MKRFFIISVILILLVLLFLFFWLFSSRESVKTKSVEKKQEAKVEEIGTGMKTLVFNDKKYLFLVEKINNPQKLILLPNFEERLTSSTLYQNNNCQFLINGGFYDENGQPLGWFFTQNKLFRKEIKSNLFNGFLFMNRDGIVLLDEFSPAAQPIWGLQTGPLLIFESQPLVLNLTHDEYDRRLAAVLNEKNELLFLVITGTDSLAFGPLLKDLPLIIKQIGLETDENFKAAVNLDGGTASAFLNQEKIIKEYTWIGSFFCLQDN